jgi:hypothetical protein
MLNENQMIIYAAGIILAVNFLSMLLFILFAKLPDGLLKEQIRNIIFYFDKFADCMENKQKRLEAIQEINSILGWRKILIPSALIGWIIDTEVAAIRKMQSANDIPNLHKEENDENNS